MIGKSLTRNEMKQTTGGDQDVWLVPAVVFMKLVDQERAARRVETVY